MCWQAKQRWRPPAEAEDPPPALHPGKRAAYFISGWAGRGAAGRGLRGSGVSAAEAEGSGADKARSRPGQAAPPLLELGETTASGGGCGMRDAGCRRRGQLRRGKTDWYHGNSQWRPQGGDQRLQRGVGPPGGFRDCVCRERGVNPLQEKGAPRGLGPYVPHPFRSKAVLRTSRGWIRRI